MIIQKCTDTGFTGASNIRKVYCEKFIDLKLNIEGKINGLAALLKKRWPHLITTHCLAHRLELAFKDAVKTSSPKLYEKATFLLGLYYLFRKSPKQKKGMFCQCFKVNKQLLTEIKKK